MSTVTLPARVHALRYEAPEVISIELQPAEPGIVFPPHEPGSHIDLQLGCALVRSYSLLNSATESQRYVVGVLKDRKSRGGSSYVHASIRVGDVLGVSAPRNNFPLDEQAESSVLVAGGIGITPMLCMLDRLAALGRRAELLYCARSRREAAFLSQLEAMQSDQLRIQFHFDDVAAGPPDLRALLSVHPKGTHFYCCGPAPMLDAFQKACDALGQPHVHLERFAAVEQTPPAQTEGYIVELRRSGKLLQVPPGGTILDAMMDNGIIPSYTCKEGICGACETKVLDGEVDHRDSILTTEERAANKTMMICVSGCRSGRLVIDA